MAFPFDQSFKLTSEEDATGLITCVAGIPLSPDAIVESLDRELNLERLSADHVYRVREANSECIHHFEALTSYRAGWQQTQLNHAIYIGLKFHVPMVSHLLLLHSRGVPEWIPDRIERASGALQQSLQVNIIRLWQRKAAEVLSAERIAMYPWTALMDASPEEQREAARRIAASGRIGLQMQMALLGTLRYGSREAFLERIGRMLLSKEILKESPLWQEIEREARAEGLEKGLEKGLEEGQAMGQARGKRQVIRLLLKARFGPIPDWAEGKLESAEGATLDKWAERAIHAQSLAAVFD